ncbi:MAG: 50S ribosomal protein L9 [Spirochaetales bacterium]|nr:50S ribosomal protein L9 [Spirochaetales bacterium]MBQ4500215.1 50S ribosomal protein L9 [Spirochaetales bacterium]MBR6235917.1 50S ribosomal protein L9 [Spirochaetales bacterium]
MKIILNQDVPNLGEEGDVCVVKDGYARNYLLPTGAAVLYNNENLSIFKSRAAAIEKRKIAKREASASLKEQLDSVTLKLVVSASETGRLFGSVTSLMIQEELAKLGYNIERKRIEVATHTIKQVGMYSARIHLYENASSVIKLDVVSEAEQKAAERAAAKAAKEAEEAAAKAAKEAAEAAAAAEAAEAQAPAEEEAVEAPATAEEN